MEYDGLVDGGSADVETSNSIEKGSIEMCAVTSRRFSDEELKDKDM